MPVLDTDVLTIVQRRSQPEFGRFIARVQTTPGILIRTTIVSFEEQLRGWLEFIKKAKIEQLSAAYEKLGELNKDFSTRLVLPMDQGAVIVFARLLRSRTGLGQMDLKIASIAISNDDILISKNLRHFRKIPELRVED